MIHLQVQRSQVQVHQTPPKKHGPGTCVAARICAMHAREALPYKGPCDSRECCTSVPWAVLLDAVCAPWFIQRQCIWILETLERKRYILDTSFLHSIGSVLGRDSEVPTMGGAPSKAAAARWSSRFSSTTGVWGEGRWGADKVRPSIIDETLHIIQAGRSPALQTILPEATCFKKQAARRHASCTRSPLLPRVWILEIRPMHAALGSRVPWRLPWSNTCRPAAKKQIYRWTITSSVSHKISLEHKSAICTHIFLASTLGSKFGSGSWPLSFVFGLGSQLLAFGSKTQDRLRDRYRSWINNRSVLET